MQREMMVVRSYLNPAYTVPCTDHITQPRIQWWAVPEKRWAYHLKRMQFETTLVLDGIQVYRTWAKWVVEGETLNLAKTVVAMKSIHRKMLDEGYKPLPYFKLTVSQKSLLRYWTEYRAVHGEYPSLSQTGKLFHVSSQQITNLLRQLQDYGLTAQGEADGMGHREWRIEEEALQRMGVQL